ELGHPHVHQDNVRPGRPGNLNRLRPVARLARHAQPGRSRDNPAKPRPDQRLIISHRHRDRHDTAPAARPVPPTAPTPSTLSVRFTAGSSASAGSGRVTTTRNPLSGNGPARNSPPHRWARSRMPARPWPEPTTARALAAEARTAWTFAAAS